MSIDVAMLALVSQHTTAGLIDGRSVARCAYGMGAEAERAAIVAWLQAQPNMRSISPSHVRANTPQDLATAIARGDHLRGEGE